jgi:RNA polymerase sigma-70 factor (ECF subfamily)
MDDAQLLARIKSGDRDALADFIADRTPQLLAFIDKRMSGALRAKVEAADILQEVTVSALGGLDTIELGDRDPFSWLCQQAERRIIDAHRRHIGAQKRTAAREVGLHAPAGASDEAGGLGDLLAASMTSPSAAFSRQQKEYHMLEALAALPDDAREAVRLRYVEGLPSKEIAERLGKSDGAVRVLLTRSLQRLQEKLAVNTEFQTLVARQRAAEEQ